MAVAELPLPPFPYEKDFFGSPFPKGGKKALCRFSERNRTRRNQMDEQEKEIEEILRTFDKAPSPSSENITLADYDFTYEIKDNQLYIDFVNESAHDATYEFSVKGDTLTLIGGEGTIGGTYELTKVHDKKADK